MDFDRPWTLDALYAEHDTCGMGRIMRSHNATVAAAESVLAAANERADEAETKLASLADTVAGALRNIGRYETASQIGLETDLREHIWTLSYAANGATEALNRANEATTRAELALEAKERELDILREYAEAHMALKAVFSEKSVAPNRYRVRFDKARDAYRRFKEVL